MTMQLLERFWPGLVQPSDEPSQTIFFEVIPSVQVAVPDSDVFPYERRDALTSQILDELVPNILRIAGTDPAAVQYRSGPGGHKRKVNPSLHCHVVIDDVAADVTAAAFGWVFRQWSVLVADLRDRLERPTGYVIVDLGTGTLSPERAEAFFMHSARVRPGLGEGFTAFDDDMLFLNVRDRATGTPYSGLDDDAFAAGLEQSASTWVSFAQRSGSGIADARLVENDWMEAPDGQHYAAKLRDVDLPGLAALRERHTELVRAALEGGT